MTDRLDEIASRLEEITVERERLFAERLTIWRAEVEGGARPPELARRSRIKAVTVRTLLARGGSDNDDD